MRSILEGVPQATSLVTYPSTTSYAGGPPPRDREVGPVVSDAPRIETVTVRWEPESKACIATVHGVDTGDIAEDSSKAALIAALPDRSAPIHLRTGSDVPYGCMIGVVDTLKRANFYRIGFATDAAR